MSQTNSSMNFLPEDYVEKRQAARAAVVFIGLLLLVVGGVVGAYTYNQWTMKGIFDENDRVTQQFEEASKKIEEARELEKQKARMVAKAEITTTLMERVRRSVLLGELTKLRPSKVNFVSMDLKSREIKPAQESNPNSDLEKARRAKEGLPPDTAKPPVLEISVDLFGTAPTDAEVAAYMSALQKSTLLSDVNLLFSEEYRRPSTKDEVVDAVRKFHVEMKINPAADLRGGLIMTSAAPAAGK